MSKITSLFSTNSKTKEKIKSNQSYFLYGTLQKLTSNKESTELSDDVKLYITINNEEEFNYSLVAYNQNYENDKSDWKTKDFPITNEREFKLFDEINKKVLVWQGEEMKKTVFFCFYIFSDSKQVLPNFLDVLTELIWSYEMEESLVNVRNTSETSSYLSKYGNIDNVEKFISDQFKDKVDDLISHIERIDLNQGEVSKENVVFSSEGKLLKYNKLTDTLLVVSETCVFKLVRTNEYAYSLVVISLNNKNQVFLSENLTQELNLQGNESQNYLIWIGKDKENQEDSAFNFIFNESNIIRSLYNIVNNCFYQQSNKCLPSEEEKDYLENINDMDVDYEEPLESIEDLGFKNEDLTDKEIQNLYNKFSIQSYTKDLTFSVKDNNIISIYTSDSNDDLVYLNSISPVKSFEGKVVNIESAKLFSSENSILLHDPTDSLTSNRIYRYDLNKQTISNEYTVPNDISYIKGFELSSKYGGMKDCPILNAFNSDMIFSIDTRVDNKNIVTNKRKYAKGTKALFNTMATTVDGKIVIGSVDGRIRMYKNDINSKSKASTSFPGLGDPILSVDISSDGKYILGTCNNYLLLIETNNGSGFDTSITKSAKTVKLKLSPLDISKYSLFSKGFTPARFNVGDVLSDSYIYTSIGKYLVIWNFLKVKKGIKSDYKIKELPQEIKYNFSFYNKPDTIVTMQKSIGVQHEIK